MQAERNSKDGAGMSAGMSFSQESKELEKQWDVKAINIPAVPYSFWGIKPALIPRFVQLYGKEAIDDVNEGQEYLNLSFSKLKKLVVFLHKNGYDTANLSEAVEQAINDKLIKNNTEEGILTSDKKIDNVYVEITFIRVGLYNMDGGPELEKALKQSLTNGANKFIKLDVREPQYVVNNRNGQLYISRPDDEHRPLVQPLEAVPESVPILIYYLKQIAQWERLLSISNKSNHAGLKGDEIKVTIWKVDGDNKQNIALRDGLAQIRLEKENAEWGISLEIELTNTNNTPLYCAALYLTSNFGAVNNLLPRIVEYLEPGQSVKMELNGKTVLPFNLNKDVEWYNWEEQLEYLKLIVNTEEFDAAPLSLDELPSAVIPGENKAAKSINQKGSARESEPDTEGMRGWSTQSVVLSQPNPQYNKVDEEKVQRMIQDTATAVFALGLYFDISLDDNLQTSYTLKEFVNSKKQTKSRLENIANALTNRKKIKKSISLADFKELVEKIYTEKLIIVADDLQKGRWGGQSNNNGLQLSATVTKALIPGFYSVEATVHSTDLNREEQLTGHVAFFLHNTFPKEIEYVLVENGAATLKLALCYEAFTLAAYTEDGTTLEIDLNEVPDYPKGFYWRDHSTFQDRIIELYKQKPIAVKDDLQKGRWGGSNNVKGKVLSAAVDSSWIPKFFNVRLEVKFSEHTSIKGEVAFFLHDSFTRQIRFVPIKDGVAELKIKAYEAFTAGAYTEDGTELELDLQNQQGYPKDFYYSKKERDSDGPLPFNNKWVLVAGTGRGKLSYEEKIMSKTLGQLLAKEGFGLICGGWFGVDKVVSKSFANNLKTKQISEKNRLIQLIEEGQNSGFEGGELRIVDRNADWYEEALKQTYALIMIGGKGGTYRAYERAIDKQIPVLPIPQTGGDALRAFNKMIEESNLLIFPDQLHGLNRPIKTNEDAQNISISILDIFNQITTESPSVSQEEFKSKVKELYKTKPVTIKKDIQKKRWGGQFMSNGKFLKADVTKSKVPLNYNVRLSVESTNDIPLKGNVAFFLHIGFHKEIEYAVTIDGKAKIEVTAHKAFTVGAYTEDGTMLELDLQQQKGFPEAFYNKY